MALKGDKTKNNFIPILYAYLVYIFVWPKRSFILFCSEYWTKRFINILLAERPNGINQSPVDSICDWINYAVILESDVSRFETEETSFHFDST